VEQAISGGQAVISGGFTVATAQQWWSGSTPVLTRAITLVSQQTISPTLGAIH